MSLNEHRKAVESAQEHSAAFESLFSRVGTRNSPHGSIMVAYRTARKSISSVLSEKSLTAVNDILLNLTHSVGQTALSVLRQSHDQGLEKAKNDLEIYGISLTGNPSSMVSNAYDAIMSKLEGQLNAVWALAQMGYSADLIVGDDSRVGRLSPGEIISDIAIWLVLAGQFSWYDLTRQSLQGSSEYVRQAIAAIDQATTNCCLRVHGQTVGMREDFRLDGTPRFASLIHDPPFHWYCRTSQALVLLQDRSDNLTAAMIDAASAELSARLTRGRIEIHPANAFSRR